MGATSSQSKQRWNADHYTQVKVSVAPDIAAAFKAKCQHNGVSMTSEISRFMSAENPTDPTPFNSRQKRRKALRGILDTLSNIRDAEQRYQDNIPQNLQNSKLYDAAENAISVLQDSIDLLSEAY
jgi:hypothetical protein